MQFLIEGIERSRTRGNRWTGKEYAYHFPNLLRARHVSVNRELKSRLADLEIKIADLRLEAKVLHDDKTIESNMVVRVN